MSLLLVALSLYFTLAQRHAPLSARRGGRWRRSLDAQRLDRIGLTCAE